MEFPRAVDRIGESDFADVFLEELQRQEEFIALDSFCDEGYVDPESIYLEIEGVTPTTDGCKVRASCKFTEVVPSSCADFKARSAGQVYFEVGLTKDDAEAVVTYDRDASLMPSSRDYEC